MIADNTLCKFTLIIITIIIITPNQTPIATISQERGALILPESCYSLFYHRGEDGDVIDTQHGSVFLHFRISLACSRQINNH